MEHVCRSSHVEGNRRLAAARLAGAHLPGSACCLTDRMLLHLHHVHGHIPGVLVWLAEE